MVGIRGVLWMRGLLVHRSSRPHQSTASYHRYQIANYTHAPTSAPINNRNSPSRFILRHVMSTPDDAKETGAVGAPAKGEGKETRGKKCDSDY